MIKTEHDIVALLRSGPKNTKTKTKQKPSFWDQDGRLLEIFKKERQSDLVALDVSVLRVHRRRVPRHVQLGGCRGLNGHILGRRRGHCRHTHNQHVRTVRRLPSPARSLCRQLASRLKAESPNLFGSRGKAAGLREGKLHLKP